MVWVGYLKEHNQNFSDCKAKIICEAQIITKLKWMEISRPCLFLAVELLSQCTTGLNGRNIAARSAANVFSYFFVFNQKHKFN